MVEPEWLDELPPGNPRAARSRRDLCRVNAWMRHHAIMAGALRNHLAGDGRRQIIELGAGDGNFLLRVAQRISPGHAGMNVALLDRQAIVGAPTLNSFASLGWRAETVVADVFDWLQTNSPADIVTANLFLHHFSNERLVELFRLLAGRAHLLIALEPRRAGWPLFCSRLLRAIGCNAVTRHDAAVSVRAGFSGTELSALWPDQSNWRLTERRAGWFSHLFIAQRNE